MKNKWNDIKNFDQKYNYLMFETILALVVVMVGIFGVSGLFPVSMNSHKNAVGISFATDAAEQFLRYNASKIKEDWSWTNAFAHKKPDGTEPTGFSPLTVIDNNLDPNGLNENNEDKKLVICHDGNTMAVGSPSSQLTGHLAHGDTIGACEDASEEIETEDFSWLDTYVFDSGNTRIYPELTFDPTTDDNSGFFLLEQITGVNTDFSAVIRAWKNVTTGADGAETATLYVEVSWPAVVPYNSAERQKQQFSLQVFKEPEITLADATYDDGSCTVTKENGGGYSTTLSSVVDNGDSTYTVDLLVDHSGCSGAECPEISQLSIETDSGTYSNVSITGISGTLNFGPTISNEPFEGFSLDSASGMGNGVAGTATVTYTLLSSLQDQQVSVLGGSQPLVASFDVADFEFVLGCDDTSNAITNSNTCLTNTTSSVYNLFSAALYNGSGSVDVNSIGNVNINGIIRSETSSISFNSINSLNVDGIIEAKTSVTTNSMSSATFNGDIYAESSISIESWLTHNGTEYITSIGTQSLPTIAAPVDANDPNYPHPITMVSGNYTIDGSLAINGTIYATGDVYINSGNSITGAGAIVAGGSIYFNSIDGVVGGTGSGDGLFLYALGGTIDLNSINSVSINGTLYAPNGSVTLNSVGSLSINGGVFASGSTININSIDSLTLGSGITYSHVIPTGFCESVTIGP